MIKYGISEIGTIPVRKESSNRSEMTSQLLFGETFQVLQEIPDWIYVKITFDQYEGWIESKAIHYISEDSYIQINSNSGTTSDLTNIVFNKNNEPVLIPPGSSLPNFNNLTKSFNIENRIYHVSNDIQENLNDITALSKQFNNCPYLWGGKNPFGIDCSGFVQVIFKIMGKKLPRDANQQVNVGETINFISDTKPGDLAFFDNDEGNITHVGIILNKGEIIHASGKVRIDKIDQQGINNLDLKKYTHKLRVIKRII